MEITLYLLLFLYLLFTLLSIQHLFFGRIYFLSLFGAK